MEISNNIKAHQIQITIKDINNISNFILMKFIRKLFTKLLSFFEGRGIFFYVFESFKYYLSISQSPMTQKELKHITNTTKHIIAELKLAQIKQSFLLQSNVLLICQIFNSAKNYTNICYHKRGDIQFLSKSIGNNFNYKIVLSHFQSL